MNRGSFALRRGGRGIGVAALVVASLGAGGGWPATAAENAECTPTAGFSDCRIFDFSRGVEDFRVPAGVTELDVRSWGEGGSGGPFANGGAGAYVAGSLQVKPGEQLSVAVGGYDVGHAFGDALGGRGRGLWAERGGSSTAIRTAGGAPLLVAPGGGGGSSYGIAGSGQAGAGGAENGHDASEAGLGGKGASGSKGGKGGGNGSTGADAEAGGAGGDGAEDGGGGGGAGYAGGGGGGGFADETREASGSGGGGSSYTDPDRLSDVRMVVGDRNRAPMKDDPFWAPSPHNSPIDSGIAEGGPNAPGGDGRVVMQWKAPEKPALAKLTRESGDNQTVSPGGTFDPMVVVAHGKDGKPIADEKVTFTLDAPKELDLTFPQEEPEPTVEVVVRTDAQGRANTPLLASYNFEAEGEFTVLATARGGVSTEFTARVKKLTTEVKAVAGDGQKAEQGKTFAKRLRAKVTDSGTPAADTGVEFRVESDAKDAPVFENGKRTVRGVTDATGEVEAPELTAGQGTGRYTVVATVGESTARFTVEVTTEASATPSPSASASPGASRGPEATNTHGGPGSLAHTGAGNMGMLAAAGAALAALGIAAVRFAPRLRERSQGQD